MPTLTNTLIDAAGRPVTGSLITIELIGVWSANGLQETQSAAVWSGTTDSSGVWTAALPAQSAYEGDTYYLVREPRTTHTCTVADSPSTQQLRDRLMTPVPVAAATGIALDDLTDVSTSGALSGKVLGFDGSIWKPTTASGGGGGGGSVNSVTPGDATITIGGTAADPTVAVNLIPESKVTNLVTDLAGKAASVHTHAESQVTGLVSDLAAKAADSAVVHNTGAENVGGVKTFTNAPLVPAPGAAGNPVRNDDSRLSDSRAPSGGASGSLSGTYPSPGIAVGAVGGTEIAAAIKDPAAGTAGLRTLGTSATQATAGNDSRLSDARTPTAHGHPESDVTGLIADLAAKADLVGGKVPTAELGSGTANSTKFLRGDQTWTAPAGGGTVTSVTNADSTIAIAGTANDPTVAVNAIAESKVTNLVTDLAGKAMALTATAVKTANYTAVAGDLVRGDSSGGVFTVTLPASSVGVLIGIKKTDSSANALNFGVTGGDTIDGVSSGSLMLSNQSRIFLGVTGGWTVPFGLNTLASLDARYALDSTLTTKGDEYVATALATLTRLGVGSDGQIRVADSTQSTGQKWATGAPTATATGLTGTTQGRFVGVTTHTAPTSGTFSVGDHVVTQDGNLYVCTIAGTPGTWVTPADTRDAIDTGEAITKLDREMQFNSVVTLSQNLRLMYFTARKSETTTQASVSSGATAAGATPTLVRWGLYTVDSSGNGTLVASIANDTSLFAAVSTLYTRSWSSPYAKVAGQRYAFGVLVISAATLPQLSGVTLLTPGSVSSVASPRITGLITGQTDLPSTFTAGSVAASISLFYGTVLP